MARAANDILFRQMTSVDIPDDAGAIALDHVRGNTVALSALC